MFIPCVCYRLCRQRSLRRADHSFREVLPGVCMCVCLSLCDIETSTMMRYGSDLGSCATRKKVGIIEIGLRKQDSHYMASISNNSQNGPAVGFFSDFGF